MRRELGSRDQRFIHVVRLCPLGPTSTVYALSRHTAGKSCQHHRVTPSSMLLDCSPEGRRVATCHATLEHGAFVSACA